MLRVASCVTAALAASGAAAVGAFAAAVTDEALRHVAAAVFGQVKASSEASSPQAELGRALFWDTRLSSDGKTACASCHFARDWGADRRRFSPDARGALTSRHSPTVFNAMNQPLLRWLGDRKSGADQAESSLTGSMGFGSKELGLAKLAELAYAAQFRAAFPDDAEPLSAANYARALGARIGEDVDLHTLPPVTGMLTIGDRAAIEPEVDLAGTWIDGDVVRIGRMRIGAGSTIGARSTLLPGARIGRGTEIRGNSSRFLWRSFRFWASRR